MLLSDFKLISLVYFPVLAHLSALSVLFPSQLSFVLPSACIHNELKVSLFFLLWNEGNRYSMLILEAP